MARIDQAPTAGSTRTRSGLAVSAGRVAGRRAVDAVLHGVTVAGIANVARGCCSCGSFTHDWVYWGATALSQPRDPRPDWAQCARCHTDPAHSWLLQLRHEAVVGTRGRRQDDDGRPGELPRAAAVLRRAVPVSGRSDHQLRRPVGYVVAVAGAGLVAAASAAGPWLSQVVGWLR